MKILFIVGSLSNGGSERVVANLSSELSKRDYEVTIALNDHENSDYIVSEDISLYNLCPNNKNKIYTFFSNIKVYRKAIKTLKPDVVISFLTKYSVYTLIASLGLNTPTIVSERNDPSKKPTEWYYRILRKMTYPLGNNFVFQTKQAQRYFSKRIQNKSVVIPNPVNLFETDLKTTYKSNITRIITAGRIVKQKNHKLLIDVFEEVSKNYPNLELFIFGDGPLKQNLINYVFSKDLQKRVQILGRTKDIYEKLKNSDLFILTSNFEGMPNILIEALAIGLPCISTDCPVGGPGELIENNVNGILVPVNDKELLLKAILSLLNDNGIAIELGNNAKKIEKSLNIDVITSKWEELIRKSFV